MQFHPFHHDFKTSFIQRLIDEHAHWLSRALKGGRRYPRIPVRKVSEGGFASLLATSRGRKKATNWWSGTLKNLDEG